MDFTRKTRVRVEVKSETENLEKLYPHNILLYHLPPLHDITIDEFEDLALDRLKVLRILENAANKELKFLSEEYKQHVIAELQHEKLRGYLRLIQGHPTNEQTLLARKNDYISHFILRLAYCKSFELKKWFLTKEMDLFRLKFSGLKGKEVQEFLETNKLEYTPLTEDQKSEVLNGLSESTIGQHNAQVSSLDFYKVAFGEVLDLVRGRKCFLRNGYAYVSSNDFISIVAAKQQAEIENGLASAERLLPVVDNDERCSHLLRDLHKSYIGKDYTVTKNAPVPIESLDQLSKKSYPMCMRMCHEWLRAKHHHKHDGRLQYGLFLKGIGVTMEDSIRFWREEFTKIMDLERFEKGYVYNIRYNYGKAGRMLSYTPYSCIKIISQNPSGPNQMHGCPFKTYDSSTLKAKLTSYGLGAGHIQEIVSFASKEHYQLACARYFEVSHDLELESGINHPNQYFDYSQMVMGNREPKSQGNQGSVKKPKKVFRPPNNDTTMMDEDDEDLWKVAETQESQVKEEQKSTDWGNDFELENLEF